jgi:Na+/H+ antiporter NhaD/arsenite permease-like protein
VSHRLGVSPLPYLISSILASNIGGTATLIGDPPNILIGSASGLGFGTFLLNLTPVVLVVFAAYLVIMRLAFRGHLQVPDERRALALEATEEHAIKDRGLLIRALVVAGATVVGFLAHSALGVEPATIALLGAAALLLVSGTDPHQAFREVEWSTLFFFVGLFILVEGIVTTGIVGGFADRLAEATSSRPEVATIALLWFSAIASAVVDNIPYTATAIPVVQRLAAGGMPAEPLWWALALGACLGGNLTIVGASANVVVSNVARQAGHPISFAQFLRYGAVVVLMSMVFSTAYLWVRYLA